MSSVTHSPATRPSLRSRPLTAASAAARVLGIALGLGLGLAGGAQAQSLIDLYQAAHGYDANYLSARASVAAAELRYQQARGVRLPFVGLGGSIGRQVSNTPNSPSTQQSSGSLQTATLSATQTVYNRANDVAIDQSLRAVDTFRDDLASADQDLILRVAQAYFDVLAAKDNVGTARASLEAIAEQVASAKRNFEVGTATIVDTREAQARYDLARFTLIQAENDLTTRRIQLDQTVGQQNSDPKALAAPFELPPLVPVAIEEWVARAEAEHPQLLKARSGLAIARLETERARAGHLPTVTLTGSYQKGHSSNAFTVPGASFDYSTPSTVSSVALTVNLPLFSGFQVQNRIKETLVLEDRSLDDLDSVRRSVVQLTRQLFYQVGSAGAQVNALEAAESSSKLALEATQLGFKVGVRVNIDVLNSQAQLYTTQAQLSKARYDRIMAGLRLRQASGRLTPEDIDRVNALLVR